MKNDADKLDLGENGKKAWETPALVELGTDLEDVQTSVGPSADAFAASTS